MYKVHTNAGITGYGDMRVRPYGQPSRDPSPFVGLSPFDFINDHRPTVPSGLLCAFYDAMGKTPRPCPFTKLLGQKKRNAIAVAAWTRPASPEVSATRSNAPPPKATAFSKSTPAPITTSSSRPVWPQKSPRRAFASTTTSTTTAASAAPCRSSPNSNETSPSSATSKTPLDKRDIDGWKRLRQQTSLPLIMHGTPLGGVQELIYGLADMYMIGGTLEDTMAAGWACGRANVQVLLQFEGGTLGKAMAMHMASVLPTHTAHSINLDDQYAEDYTTETIPVVDGASPVPDGPGLGFAVDEDALARLAAQSLVERPTHVGVLQMPGGHTYYGPSYISPTSITGHQEGVDRGFRSSIWEDDGSAEFVKIHDRVNKEGVFRAD